MPLHPHEFWQQIQPSGVCSANDAEGYTDSYPAQLPDGRCILLPVRVLPGDGDRAVASLIVNQASFAVEGALSEVMTAILRPIGTEVIVGVPTLGLPLANAVARKLGHSRMVALGTSRKFWYEEALSEPMSSITTRDTGKRVYLDPRMLPVLAGRRVAVVDDVISTGSSALAVLRLLATAGISPVAMGFAMLQGRRWEAPLRNAAPGLPVLAALRSPLLEKAADGRWRPMTD